MRAHVPVAQRMRAYPEQVVEIAKRMPERMRVAFALRNLGFSLSHICAELGIKRAELYELLADAVLQLSSELPRQLPRRRSKEPRT